MERNKDESTKRHRGRKITTKEDQGFAQEGERKVTERSGN